jgi:hypothetical protein
VARGQGDPWSIEYRTSQSVPVTFKFPQKDTKGIQAYQL